MTDAVSAKCSMLTGPIDWCNANEQTPDKPIGVVVFCSLATGPLFTCNKFIDQIKAFARNSEGVILRATWAKAASPIIQSASELLADAIENSVGIKSTFQYDEWMHSVHL